MPQASAKSNTVKPDKPNEPIFTPRFIAGFAVNFILYMQYYALMVAMAGYSAMQFAAGATEGGFTASVFILGALCSRLFFGGAIDKVGRGRVLVACMTGEVACTLLYLAFEHVPAIGVFIVLRFLHGAFYGLSQTTVTSIVSSAVPFSRKGEGVGYYMLSVTLGAALGPLMGSAFSNAGDFDMLFFSCLGMIAVGYVAALGVVLPGRRQCSEVSKATGATEVAHGVPLRKRPGYPSNLAMPASSRKRTSSAWRISSKCVRCPCRWPSRWAISRMAPLSPISIRTRPKWGLQVPRASFSCRIPLPCS